MVASVLRFSRLHVCRKNHILNVLSEIPAFDYLITLFLLLDSNFSKSGRFEHPLQFLHGNRAGDSAAVSVFILLYSFGEVTLLQDVRDCKSPP